MKPILQLRNVLIGLAYAVLCVGMFYSGWGIEVEKERAKLSAAENRFAQLEIALVWYHQTHGAFPPTKYQPEPGGPIHSWRILLIPYFASANFAENYSNYDFSKEWNMNCCKSNCI